MIPIRWASPSARCSPTSITCCARIACSRCRGAPPAWCSRLGPPPAIEAQAAAALHEQQQERAEDGEVLHEMDALPLAHGKVFEFPEAVRDQRGTDRKQGHQ